MASTSPHASSAMLDSSIITIRTCLTARMIFFRANSHAITKEILNSISLAKSHFEDIINSVLILTKTVRVHKECLVRNRLFGPVKGWMFTKYFLVSACRVPAVGVSACPTALSLFTTPCVASCRRVGNARRILNLQAQEVPYVGGAR